MPFMTEIFFKLDLVKGLTLFCTMNTSPKLIVVITRTTLFNKRSARALYPSESQGTGESAWGETAMKVSKTLMRQG